MTYQFTVSPDFSPEHISGWFIFNTWLQKETGQRIHLELHNDFASQRADIHAGKVDMIYANPSDAALLVREKGFIGVARPVGISDEAIVVAPADSPSQSVEDLPANARVAVTDHPDVRMMGMIMLEPANITRESAVPVECATYVLVAKALMTGRADAGIFLKAGWDDLSAMVKKGLRPLVTGQIQLVRHGLLVGPNLAPQRDALCRTLVGMSGTPRGQEVLRNLGFGGWEPFEQEEVEFMIDLMDTLVA